MSARRSSRLANKTGKHSSEGDVLLNGDAKERCTPHQSHQKRKRRRSAARVTDDPEVRDVLTQGIFEELTETPKVLTQHRKTLSSRRSSLNGSVAFSPLSLENDLFLLAVEKIETNEKNVAILSEDVNSQSETVCSENSPDIFGDDDDAELLEALPPTPDPPNQVTPKRSSERRSIPKKKLSILGDAANPGDEVTNQPAQQIQPKKTVDFQTAKEIYQLEQGLDTFKEPKPKRGRKQSVNGEKKKNGPGKMSKEKKKKKAKFKLAFTNRKSVRELANSASNELAKDDLSILTTEEKLQLSSWGLPASILNNYRAKGITSLFPWQLECLANERVLEGKNLLYSAPTSAGKTLVSEILMIKRVLELGRKAIMILPFVSVAREKVYSLQSIFGDAGVRVEGFMGSVNPPGGFKAVDIAICTIEKANSLLNKLLEEDGLADLGTLVVDELHLIGDAHRGYLLELLLTKILYMTSLKNQNENSLNMSEASSWRPKRFHIQVIGMSATLPNLDVLADWLKAELYVTDFRPVPLKERLKVDDKLYDEKLEHVRNVITEDLPLKIDGDTDNIVYLSLETVLSGFSALIFCPTKLQVEQIAKRIADNFYRIGDPTNNFYPEVGEKLRNCLNGSRIKSVLEQLRQCPGGADEVLSKTIMFGIGYHHAGLTYENRDIVESAFKRGILRVIVATSTLSAGVNLPARRVMIATPMFNGNVLDTMTYRQMCGRAGRNGIDTEGESILISPPAFKEKGMQLFKSQIPIVKSALLGDGTLTSSMKRALLEAIASGIASLTTDVRSYARCTFLFHSIEAGLYQREELSLSQANKDHTIEQCLEFLESQDFIRVKHFEQEDRQDEYMPTQLGSACLASSLSPDDGIIVYKELQKARECFVLENELHVLYQVTPIYVSDQLRNISWQDYLKIWENLNVSEKKVAELVGIKEGFIIRAMIGSVSWKNPNQRLDMAIHQRFFAALALSDLVNEKSLEYVGSKYNLSKGVLQNLQQAASTFAGMVTAFCGRLGWSNLELLLSQFQERLEFGVQRELCDLVRLECLNGQRARILYDAGLKNIVELAAADPAQVEQILHKATPFISEVHGGKESTVWMIGKESLTEAEAARKIVEDARNFIQIELGQQGNIQFAFGSNDVPTLTGIKQAGRDGSSTIQRANDVTVSNPNDRSIAKEEFSKTSLREADKQKPSPINNDKQQHEEMQEGTNKEIEDLYSQRHAMMEESPSPGRNDPVNNDDFFEDSFPEIVPTNISALYNKDDNAESKKTEEKFCIKDEVERIDMIPRVTNRVQCDGVAPPRCESVNDQLHQHRTPVVAVGDYAKRQRFTLKQEVQASPVCHASPESCPELSESQENVLDQNCHELSNGVLAELEKNFDCISVLESSIEMCISERNDVDVKSKCDKKMSESVAAAMQALADDSNFDSEELFPDEANTVIKQSKSPANLASENQAKEEEMQHSSMPENGRCGGFDEEDFILTQEGSSDHVVEKEENEIFEESCSENESLSVWTDNSAFKHSDISAPSDEFISVQEIALGKRKISIRIVKSVDLIPLSFFPQNELVGMGIKLVSNKKPSASIARQGIGSRVVGTCATYTSATLGTQAETSHSLSIYNGLDIIWVLRWEVESGLRVGGTLKHPKNNEQLEKLWDKIKSCHCSITIFESKDQIKRLLKQCGDYSLLGKLPSGNKIWDPKIAQWMWDFDDEDWNLSRRKIIDDYVVDDDKKILVSDLNKDAIEAFLAWKVMTKLKEKLLSRGLWNHFINTEMPSIIPLLLMEMNGLGLDSIQLSKLKRVLQFKAALLELRAFQLAGRQFNLSSPKDIKQVLFRDIGLKQPKAKGTSKNVLLKLDHELPVIIVEWRKVTNALQKVVIPFQQEKNLETGRVHGQYSHFTVTGRVVMSDPSLQLIPQDFDIDMAYDADEIEEIRSSCKIKFGSKLAALFQQLDTNAVDAESMNGISVISMRNAFIPHSADFVILTADYSQLELRILAHLSGDAKLLEALNKDTDVFTEISALWKNVPPAMITSSVRQEAKSIVYGVIYGMGARTLAEQMEIDEREASQFISQFMRTYPGISTFIERAHKLCQEKGYVETMTGRRRYLPSIHSKNPHEKAKAIRQAVNSQIQGSAADLVKTAMAKIHSFMHSWYPKSAYPVEWSKIMKSRRSSLHAPAKGTAHMEEPVVFPVLNLHDELIFEVRKSSLLDIARIVKEQMESCVKLHVKLPVVIKTGESWGTMEVLESI